MNNNVKFAVVLALAVIVSMATSYVTTLSLNQANQQTSIISSPQPTNTPQITQQPTNTPEATLKPTTSPIQQLTSIKILPAFNVSIEISLQYVRVYSNVVIHNLTIVYNYTSLNGTNYMVEVSYGDYYPAWGAGVTIDAGATPTANYRIPQHIISDCSKIKTNSDGPAIIRTWDIYPQLNITEVYGYS